MATKSKGFCQNPIGRYAGCQEACMMLDRCLDLEWFSSWLVAGSIVLLSLVLFGFVFYLLPKMLRRFGGVVLYLRAIRYPGFCLLLLSSLILALQFTPLPSFCETILSRLSIILFIASVGWWVANSAGMLHGGVIARYTELSVTDLSKRSILTQATVLYRVAMVLIVTLTAAAILLTFPGVRSIGLGILGSAGIAGIALGIAARPILLNFMAGFQIALNKSIKLGDTVIVEGEWGWIEKIFLTHVIIKVWDLRRLVVPISYFIDRPFQNWSIESTDLIGVVTMNCDYTVPVNRVREKLLEILEESETWDRKAWGLVVTDCDDKTVTLRATMSAKNSGDSWNLRCLVREKLIEFLQTEFPTALPKVRRD